MAKTNIHGNLEKFEKKSKKFYKISKILLNLDNFEKKMEKFFTIHSKNFRDRENFEWFQKFSAWKRKKNNNFKKPSKIFNYEIIEKFN